MPSFASNFVNFWHQRLILNYNLLFNLYRLPWMHLDLRVLGMKWTSTPYQYSHEIVSQHMALHRVEVQGMGKFPSIPTFENCSRRSELFHCFFHCTFIVSHPLCSFYSTVKILLLKCFLEGMRPGFKLFIDLKKGIKNCDPRNHLNII